MRSVDFCDHSGTESFQAYLSSEFLTKYLNFPNVLGEFHGTSLRGTPDAEKCTYEKQVPHFLGYKEAWFIFTAESLDYISFSFPLGNIHSVCCVNSGSCLVLRK